MGVLETLFQAALRDAGQRFPRSQLTRRFRNCLKIDRCRESCYAGWPGGHCLRVPKEQEGVFCRYSPLQKRLMDRIAGRKSPLVAPRPGRGGVRATQPQ